MTQAFAEKRILVVEDEADIRELMALHLSREGYYVQAVADGEAGLRKIGEDFDLLVLDWMLPGASGIDIAKAVRSGGGPWDGVPILMVTARVEPADIVLGLEAGADDYVTKPFEVPVFLARVRALLRRSARARGAQAQTSREAESVLKLGGVKLDCATYQASSDGQPLQLTHSEFKLLLALVKSEGRVLTRAGLIDLVQGSDVSVVDRTIDTHVFGLRKKLGANGELIETVRGVGYRVRTEV